MLKSTTGFTLPVDSYTILNSNMPAEQYAFGNWEKATGSIMTYLAEGGQVWNALTNDGANPSEFNEKLPKALSTYLTTYYVPSTYLLHSSPVI